MERLSIYAVFDQTLQRATSGLCYILCFFHLQTDDTWSLAITNVQGWLFKLFLSVLLQYLLGQRKHFDVPMIHMIHIMFMNM